MGEKKVKIIDVARETGISRNMISALYYENAKRIDIDALDSLCRYFHCQPADLFEYIIDADSSE
ncbi:MAG: helix-turn-helix transcriptional regulator [Mariprofundaceae bacterium]|nr:helix-turn-helix transcriptional regulator [Mariprofundaceae bacterium]